jgi:hypothetical protein
MPYVSGSGRGPRPEEVTRPRTARAELARSVVRKMKLNRSVTPPLTVVNSLAGVKSVKGPSVNRVTLCHCNEQVG